MKKDKTVEALHPHEKKIIAALHELGKATPEEIATKTNLPEASVHKAGMWSKIKGLLYHEETVHKRVTITEEGKQYGRAGLPEKKLLELVQSGTTTIPDLRKQVKNMDIALGWAKRKGWVTIKGGTLTLTKDGKHTLTTITDVEHALRGKEPDEQTLRELTARKLVTVQEKTTKHMQLTAAGKTVATKLPAMMIEDVGQLTPNDLKSGAWKKKQYRPYAVDTPVPTVVAGKFHPYMTYLQRLREKLVAQGFEERRGPWVETEFWNADALFMPQDHPARSIHDVFHLKTPKQGAVTHPSALKLVGKVHQNGWITGSRGWGSFDPKRSLGLVLRSQTTAVSARILAEKPTNTKYFIIGRNFRVDKLDATHSYEFYQCDCIVIGDHLNMRHLYAYLTLFAKEIAGADKIRFRPSYFPFVEPGVEVDAFINGKWIEVAGAGIFRPEMTKPLGEDRTVLAWAFGLDRLAMRSLDIKDIRHLYQPDLNWLRKAPLVV
ncbi:MAG: phenylalanine--tRNA ligase subunit alpha [Nanoarchaeota archaeon]|nr:phenylalanine--tRNA ligase subunit alpha [Nanoarchaeota archaeon]